MMSKNGRIVNVSSTGSSLTGYSKEIQDRFRSSELTLKDLEQMMKEYQVNPPLRWSFAGTRSRQARKQQIMAPKAKMDGNPKHTEFLKRRRMR